jgi:hypothetical protein
MKFSESVKEEENNGALRGSDDSDAVSGRAHHLEASARVLFILDYSIACVMDKKRKSHHYVYVYEKMFQHKDDDTCSNAT